MLMVVLMPTPMITMSRVHLAAMGLRSVQVLQIFKYVLG